MKKNAEPLQPNSYYHIYNRGINGESIFKEHRNYLYFLEKYTKYIEPIAQTFSYCLLKNHFHIAIKTRSNQEILNFYTTSHPNREQIPSSSEIISRQFSHLFNSYSQAINKSYNRTGGLFEEPFLRILIENDEYLKQIVVYIHRNPQKHGFLKDFKMYAHSSYRSMLSDAPTKLQRAYIIDLFGDKNNFIIAHQSDFDDVDWSRFEGM